MAIPARILHTRSFRKLFWSLVGQGPTDMAIVSPYLGGLPEFDSTVAFAQYVMRVAGTSLTLITRPPLGGGADGIITETEANGLEALGVNLLVRQAPLLHSKVYRMTFGNGKQVGFVGSANFSLGGFCRNDETVAFFAASADNERIAYELARLGGEGTIAYAEWRLIKRFYGEAV